MFEYLNVNTFEVIKPLLQCAAYSGFSYGIYSFYKTFKTPINKICKANELTTLSGDGIQLSKNVRLSEKQSFEHILCVAPSGFGKTRRIVMHNVKNLEDKDCSIVVTDPSKEIKDMFPCSNKRVYVLNPLDKNSIGFDPLKNCKSEEDVEKLAKTILINGIDEASYKEMSEWIEMSQLLLSAFLIATWVDGKNSLSNAIGFITTRSIFPTRKPKEEVTKNNICVMDIVMTGENTTAKDKFLAFAKVCGAQQTLSCIQTMMNTSLKCFLDTCVSDMMNKPNFDISLLREENCAVYIQIPERRTKYYKPIVATFLSQIFDMLMEVRGNDVYCILDEFTNCCKLDEIDCLLSTIRKYRISIFALVQSIAQLERTYPDVKLTDFFKTICVGCGLKDTADIMSTIIGKDKGGDVLMSADEIRRMQDDELLIICNNKRAVVDKMLPIVM